MSRTTKGSKPRGYDYWSKRPYSGNYGFGKAVKNLTHRKERAIDKQIEYEESKKLGDSPVPLGEK